MDSKQVLEQLDRAHLVEMTRDLADIVTITGEEQPVAEYLGREFERLGMDVEYPGGGGGTAQRHRHAERLR